MVTPETKDPNEEVEPYGPEASDYTSNELEGEEVELEFDAERKDQHDRLLAYVYPVGEEMFNEDLLESGHAQLYTVPPNDKYEGRFEAAQDEAREIELGIWGLSHDPSKPARVQPTAGVRASVALPSPIGGQSAHGSRPPSPCISCVTISLSSCLYTSSWTAIPTMGWARAWDLRDHIGAKSSVEARPSSRSARSTRE